VTSAVLARYDGYALSFGGGVNSVAMTIMLVNEGWRGPIVFADTGAEWPETYCYMGKFELLWLAPRGLAITTLLGAPWQTGRARLPLLDFCESKPQLPSPAFRWCTTDWKRRPCDRWLKAYPTITEYLIGIAADERHRRPEDVRPLVDRGITREGCIKIIEAAGLSVPQKSGCVMCPYQRIDQWRRLWQVHPEIFSRIEAIEQNVMRTHHCYGLRMDGKTLAQMRLSFEGQASMFDDADMDKMLRFRPCECTL
jgi:hypothetical protein